MNTSGGKQRYQNYSKPERWLYKLRTSRRAKRKFLHFCVIFAAVLLAFMIGFYYFGPSFSSVGE